MKEIYLQFFLAFKYFFYELYNQYNNKMQQNKVTLRETFRVKKYLFLFSLFLLNGVLIFLLIFFDNSWIQFLIVSLILLQLAYLTIEIILIILFYIGKKIRMMGKQPIPVNFQTKTLAMNIPCYNQQEEELMNTINAYLSQEKIQRVKKMMIVVVDGKIKTRNQKRVIGIPQQQIVTAKTLAGSKQISDEENQQRGQVYSGPITTNVILKDIFKESISNSVFFDKAYLCWKKQWLGVQVYDGIYRGVPYLVVVKDQNCSKRDSLALVYKLLYHLSGQEQLQLDQYNPLFMEHLAQICRKNGIKKFDYMMTTDADSEPSPNSAYDMICDVERKPLIFGTTGQVQVRFSNQPCNLIQLTQFQEYIASQSVIRLQQKLTSEKIQCLPGSLNIIKVCKETCGKDVLNQYRFISDTTSLTEYIKNSASQDRHHIMIMFGLYGYAKTSMIYDAIVRTSVPVTIKHFLSQRKRWNLGTVTHNIYMAFGTPNIPLWERISALTIVLQFLLMPLLMFCYGRFIALIVRYANGTIPDFSTYFIILMALAGFRFLFMLAIGIFTPGMPLKHRILYIVLMIPFIAILNPIRALSCFLYNCWHLDDFNWIKGEQVLKVDGISKNQNSKSKKSLQFNQKSKSSESMRDLNLVELEKYNIYKKQNLGPGVV